MHENQISRIILDAAIEVHRTLGGPGLLESVYEEALAWELEHQGLPVERQKVVPVVYKGQTLTTPLRLDLLVGTESPEGPVYARFSLPYRVPARLVRQANPQARPGAPRWWDIWRNQARRVAVLAAALIGLTLILVFQDAIARHRTLYHWLRYGFLGFVLVWLGWYAGAQLSVVNVITFAHALLSGFRWETFLVAPLIFILWCYVAVALVFWGRGVFCGWLCPFGALQELLNRGVRRLGVPQLRLPFVLHERLWMTKYVVFLALFALSLGGYDLVQPFTEVEPFKTAIVLRFARDAPFVIYALALLAVGLFIERAFCRYLCPLGAALAIPARLRMFEWLKRRFQCGSQCQICAVRCTVQAIHPDGHINPNECIHCLNCQVLHYDSRTCPPLIARRKRRAAARAAQVSSAMEAGDAAPGS
jgi:polyferredoxin